MTFLSQFNVQMLAEGESACRACNEATLPAAAPCHCLAYYLVRKAAQHRSMQKRLPSADNGTPICLLSDYTVMHLTHAVVHS